MAMYAEAMYKTSTIMYVLRALVAACHVVAKKCSHTSDVLARASSLSVFLSVITKQGAICIARIEDTHTNLPRARQHPEYGLIVKTSLKTGTNLAILKQCTRPGSRRKVFTPTSFHSSRVESCHVNAVLFRPGLSHPGMKAIM